MPPVIARYYEQRMSEDEQEAGKIASDSIQSLRGKVQEIDRQIERLTDVYIALPTNTTRKEADLDPIF